MTGIVACVPSKTNPIGVDLSVVLFPGPSSDSTTATTSRIGYSIPRAMVKRLDSICLEKRHIAMQNKIHSSDAWGIVFGVSIPIVHKALS